MSTECEALARLLEVVEAAITSGDWTVDGACDPDAAIEQAKRVLRRHNAREMRQALRIAA